METLQKNLVVARTAKGWTMQDAENHTGVKAVTIGSYERGYRLPPLNMLMRLASHYEVTVAWLIGENCPKCNTESRIAELEGLIKSLMEAKQ